MGEYALGFWDSMGHARLYSEFIILLETLTWETLFKYFEFCFRLFNVDHLDGKNRCSIENTKKSSV